MSRKEPPVERVPRVSGSSVVRFLLAWTVVIGVFVVLMFAAAQQGLPQFGTLQGAAPGGKDDEGAEVTPQETAPPPLKPTEDTPLLRIIGAVLAVLVVVAVLALLLFAVRILIRRLRDLWLDRPLARQTAAELEATQAAASGAESSPDAAMIRRGIDEAIRVLDTPSHPGNSIVAAWVGLEESAADAGVGRAPHETPSEFTVRIVGARAAIAADVRDLLALYEQVRFGGLDADETHRAAAAASLRGIRAGWR